MAWGGGKYGVFPPPQTNLRRFFSPFSPIAEPGPMQDSLNAPVPRLVPMFVSYWAHRHTKIEGHLLSRCFRDFLIRRRFFPANSTVRRTCLACAGELSKLDTDITIFSYKDCVTILRMCEF